MSYKYTASYDNRPEYFMKVSKRRVISNYFVGVCLYSFMVSTWSKWKYFLNILSYCSKYIWFQVEITPDWNVLAYWTESILYNINVKQYRSWKYNQKIITTNILKFLNFEVYITIVNVKTLINIKRIYFKLSSNIYNDCKKKKTSIRWQTITTRSCWAVNYLNYLYWLPNGLENLTPTQWYICTNWIDKSID